MLDRKVPSAGFIWSWIWRQMRQIGQLPSTTRCSESDGDSPALAAFLHITVRPSWKWSPTGISCLDPRTQGPCTPGLSSLDAHETASWQVSVIHMCSGWHVFMSTSLWTSFFLVYASGLTTTVSGLQMTAPGSCPSASGAVMLPMFLIWLYRARVCSGGLMTLMESWMTLNQVSDSSSSADLWLC